MLVSFALGDANLSSHLTQDPQRESVEYRLRWVPNANFLRWPCTFHIFCEDFICVGYPTRTPFPVELWALCLSLSSDFSLYSTRLFWSLWGRQRSVFCVWTTSKIFFQCFTQKCIKFFKSFSEIELKQNPKCTPF